LLSAPWSPLHFARRVAPAYSGWAGANRPRLAGNGGEIGRDICTFERRISMRRTESAAPTPKGGGLSRIRLVSLFPKPTLAFLID
jgi:hypothetical protein